MFFTVDAEMPLRSAATSRVMFKNSLRMRIPSPTSFNISFLFPRNITMPPNTETKEIIAKQIPVYNRQNFTCYNLKHFATGNI